MSWSGAAPAAIDINDIQIGTIDRYTSVIARAGDVSSYCNPPLNCSNDTKTDSAAPNVMAGWTSELSARADYSSPYGSSSGSESTAYQDSFISPALVEAYSWTGGAAGIAVTGNNQFQNPPRVTNITFFYYYSKSHFAYQFSPRVDMYYAITTRVLVRGHPTPTVPYASASVDFIESYNLSQTTLHHNDATKDPLSLIDDTTFYGMLHAGRHYALRADGECAVQAAGPGVAGGYADADCNYDWFVTLKLLETPFPPDADADGLADTADNCPSVRNADQLNTDNANDGGDACDLDDDNDNWEDFYDNCPLVINDDQADSNNDGVGNACDRDSDGVPNEIDNCVWRANPDQLDADGNGKGDVCNDWPPGC